MNDLQHEAQCGLNEGTGEWIAHIIVRGFTDESDAKAWTQEFNNIGGLHFEQIVFVPEKRQ